MSWLVRVYGFNGESLWALSLKFFRNGEGDDIVNLTE